MEERLANHKTAENGVKGKPPCVSVETPYGFQLDLDFLRYVDDIEKGNTIKRVPIQRRSKGPRSSTLPRHLNTSGSGYRPSPWGSTGTLLGPRSRLSDGHQHGFTSWTNGHRSSLSPTGLKSLSEMEARIKEFDEQPLGEHIRPHLLRASSLPLTVLLRQSSESTDEPGSLRSSRDRLGGKNISCEDIFCSPDSSQHQDYSGLLRRLTEALERVGELEMEVRVIPELKAQICILQEERERLRLGLSPQTSPSSLNGTADPYATSHYGTADVKRPRHESHAMISRNHYDSNPTHEWRTSTDLDELLTVTSLQAKVAVLEQKLYENGQELQKALGLLREQREESRKKDGRIEYLNSKPGVWVHAERVVVDQDGGEVVVRSMEPHEKVLNLNNPDEFATARPAMMNGQKGRRQESGPGDVVLHIKKIKRLLEQQWECLCSENRSGDGAEPLQHPDPKVNSLQQEMMGLVDVLASSYTNGEGEEASSTRTDALGRTSHSLRPGCGNEGGRLAGQYRLSLAEHEESSINPSEKTSAQVDPDPDPDPDHREGEQQTSPDRQMISGGAGSGWTDGGVASVEAEAPEKTVKSKAQPPGEQMEGRSGSDTTAGGRDSVSPDFMASCLFLKDHMDNMDNPNDDMRKALVVLFQLWFSAAAEEASEAGGVAAYLREVKKTTPSLLAFLVNLADDNGNTVLHYSVSHCNYSIVSLLLDTGVTDVNIQNKAGYTAVMLAALTAPDGPGGMEVVRKLMETGNVHICSSQTGQTALHLAVRHGRVVMVRLLLSCGVDANIQDNQGTTALMFAAERGHTHVARLLLERSQCDLALSDKRGRTALTIAMQGSHTDTATLLQAHAKARAL
ncbi:uncharacterized protein V6R79_013184 [Siganus canaliculatus]